MKSNIQAVSRWLRRHHDRLMVHRLREAQSAAISIAIDVEHVAALNGIDADTVVERLAAHGGVPLVEEGRRKIVVRLSDAPGAATAARGSDRSPRQRRRGLFSGPLDYIIVGMIVLTLAGQYLPAEFQLAETIRHLFMTMPSQP